MRAAVRNLLLLSWLLAVPAIAAAQEFEIRGPANAQVFVITDEGRLLLGTLGADGGARIPRRLVREGRELEVVLNESGATPAVALVERGRKDDTCLDTSPAGSRCRYTGTFLTWGRVDSVTISPAGQVTIAGAQAGAADSDDDLDWGIGFIGSADVGRAFLANEDRLCDEALLELAAFATGCDSETTVNAFGADVGVTFARFLAAKVGYLDVGRASFNVSAMDAGITGNASGFFGRTRGVTLTLSGRFDVGPVVPFVEGGVWRWSGQQGFEGALNTSPPITFSDTFEIDSWDVIWGGGIEFWFHRNVGISASFRNVRMQTDDTAAIEGTTVDETFRIFMIGLKVGNR